MAKNQDTTQNATLPRRTKAATGRFLTTGCRWDPNYCCACIKKTTTQPEIRGGVDAHPFVSFPFISFSLCFASLCFVSFGHSLTHQFVSSFVRSSQSLNCCCLVIAIVSCDFHYLQSMPNSDMIWGSENSDYGVCLHQYLTNNKHPTNMKHAIGNFNTGHNFLRLFGFLIVQTSKGVQMFFPASCCYLYK